jgi:hypothetical protein
VVAVSFLILTFLAGGLAQAVAQLPHRHETLRSNPSTVKNYNINFLLECISYTK